MPRKENSVLRQKKSNKSMILSAIFLAALMAVTFYIVFSGHSIESIIDIVATVDPIYITLAFLMMIGYVFFQAAALKAPIKQLGLNASWRTCTGIALVGIYFSAITPSSTGGQPLQLYYLTRKGISTAAATLALLVTNIAYQVVLMVYGVVMLVLRFSFVSNTVTAMAALMIYGYAIMLIVLLALWFAMTSKKFAYVVVRFFVRVLAKIRIIKDKDKAMASADAQLINYTKGAQVIKTHPVLFGRVLLCTFAQFACYFLVPYFIYKSFGLHDHNMLDLLAVNVILFIAVSYLPLPGSVGVAEQGFVSLFTVFFSSSLLVPAMLLSRGITFYFMLIISGAATAVIHFSSRKKQQNPEQQAKPEHSIGA